ncbi:MAG: Lrp/AsnC family transcriptional regulator, partial [Caldilineaceae bacterium]|nr:Lrp/AsnC family transcriptional regulator [Caldilineaceae bacterium]
MAPPSALTRLDEIDRAILELLQHEGRISNADLARRINLSPPATYTRVRRLEQEGYITGYAAHLNREKLGYGMLCYISVSLQMHQFNELAKFRERLIAMPEVLECSFVTGEFDYLLKVVLRDQKDLERFILQELTPLPGVARVNTSLVGAELKSTTAMSV